jgi:hypothetical protein
MTDLDRRVVQKALTKKGFKDEAGAKHDLWWYYRGNPAQKTAVRIAISRGKQYRTFGNDIIKLMKMELGLESLGDAKKFLVCMMQIDEYERIVGPKFQWDEVPKPR